MPAHLSARKILEKLVSFPTVSSESNLDLVDWVEDYLDGFGVTAHRKYNADGTKASLFASVGPDVTGGVILSGHTDVVPVAGQNWATDPWAVTEKQGRLYGRGTCDMKGFDALALAAVPLAIERGVSRPLQIALSRDEEVGCIGAPDMIDEMAAILPRAALAIVGEPSMMKTVTGHKGSTGFHVHLRGFEVHSSLQHKGVNAVMFAAKLIEWANQKFAENAAAVPSAVAGSFDPPYTTVHVGTIRGGTAHNITAKDCWMELDIRCVPDQDIDDWAQQFGDKVDEVAAQMQAIHPDGGIDLDRYFDIPPLRPETDGAAEKLVRSLTGDNGTHVVSYGTEAGQFQERGYSTVICGPGDIAQAHQPNEFIALSQFEAGEKFVARVVDSLTG